MHRLYVFEISLPADIKGFLSDVKPALLSALDAEYEKNPFEVCRNSVIVWKMCSFHVFLIKKIINFNLVQLTGW